MICDRHAVTAIDALRIAPYRVKFMPKRRFLMAFDGSNDGVFEFLGVP
jgi:hypothetical protein